MNRQLLVLTLVSLLSAGCVSTTTDSKASPGDREENPQRAAEPLGDHGEQDGERHQQDEVAPDLQHRRAYARLVEVKAQRLTRVGVVVHVLAGAGVRLVDGSGLSLLDRLTARTLAGTLETIAHVPALRPLLDTFAVAGATGTLRHRLLGVPGHQLVRGKTGTTDHSSALAGFVGKRFAFAIINNGGPVNWAAAHQLQDRVAEALLAAA